jgi:hypothetical protein
MKNQSPRSRPKAGGSNAAEKAARELRERYPDANEFARAVLQPQESTLSTLDDLVWLLQRFVEAKITPYGSKGQVGALVVFSEREVYIYTNALVRVIRLGKAG